MTTRRHTQGQAAFTLIEILVTLAIMVILAALLLPAVNKAKRTARRTQAAAEVSQLQQAVASYVRDTAGPKYNFDTVDVDADDLEADMIVVKSEFAAILAGQNINSNNPLKRKYMEFRRFDAKGSPVTPWWKSNLTTSVTDNRYRYFVKLDRNFDDRIKAGGGEPNDPPRSIVPATVVAWTYNMDEAPTASNLFIIRSWEQ